MTIDDVKAEVERLALKIDAPAHLFPTYDFPIGDGHPFVEVERNGHLHYIIKERNEELDHRMTISLDELMYLIFKDITFSMACRFELKHRINGKDSRRQMFQKQEELMRILNSSWEQRVYKAHEDILERHPFDDMASIRADYFSQLRQQGYSEPEITEMAYQKYPQI